VFKGLLFCVVCMNVVGLVSFRCNKKGAGWRFSCTCSAVAVGGFPSF
jgi:hypothetical protein